MNVDRISPALDLALPPCLSNSAPLVQNHWRHDQPGGRGNELEKVCPRQRRPLGPPKHI